ncbi:MULTISPECIES: SMP-30/gluconolactonase/LRE family protein [unclassified Acidovorax]|uniref:SMP-30/gluconolactonase/LRE family protein n=1 Tax=unclassified Acidovorax TaxID=2684926 RepID=UPI002882FDC2|nr:MULTISPECIES: SMP-30/gluconolactonase/LRE family protein [unclassified Acidovorax]
MAHATAAHDAELVLDARCATGESPVWRAHDQSLYWADIPAGVLHRWSMAQQPPVHQQWRAPEMLACMAAVEGGAPGQWIAGLESGVFLLDVPLDGAVDQLAARSLAAAPHARSGMRFNDGRCDRQGRFIAGTMLQDMGAAARVGRVYRYGEQEAASGRLTDLELGELIVPNGIAFSPDGRTMYLSDSHPQVQAIWAFDYDTDTGTPHNRRLFADMTDLPGRPDGAAVDVDGGYWICGNDAGLVHRFTPDGRLDRSLAVPVKKPAMCAFGGPAMDTLYVTSIRLAGVDLSDQPLAGGVFALRPGVQGVPEPGFRFAA